MSAPEFVDLGRVHVHHLTRKAALVRFESERRANTWVPFSQMSTLTASRCRPGFELDHFRVTKWFRRKLR